MLQSWTKYAYVDFLKCHDVEAPSPKSQCWAGLFAFRTNTSCTIETGGGVSGFSLKKKIRNLIKKCFLKKSTDLCPRL